MFPTLLESEKDIDGVRLSQSLLNQVNVSDGKKNKKIMKGGDLSQSLLNQVNVSDLQNCRVKSTHDFLSQSLLNQVNVSDIRYGEHGYLMKNVAIPSKSGQCFRHSSNLKKISMG